MSNSLLSDALLQVYENTFASHVRQQWFTFNMVRFL